MSKKLLVARLGKSFGLKGFLRLHNLSDFIEQFKPGAIFFDEKDQKYIIKSFDKKNQIVLFEGFEDINSAKTLINLKLYQSEEITRKTCKLKKDEFFYFDILGLNIFENDKLIGHVVDILETSASYLFLIKCDDNLVDQGYIKEFYLPYVDHYILDIDIKNKSIKTQNVFILLESLK